jgi:SAM-dependent methyltransferase
MGRDAVPGKADPYAVPRHVTDPADCYFYHTMDLPGQGTVQGEWDLRAGIDAYLGGVSCRGKRVLEVGTASGFVCFALERQRAEVVAYDLSPEEPADVVPFARADWAQRLREHQVHVARLNNAFWFGHRLLGSRARLVHGSAYAVPEAIGPVDVATFGCVLLHLRDPFQALASALRLTRETAVVTEPLVLRSRLKRLVLRRLFGPWMLFVPRWRTATPSTTWWVLSPEVIQGFLGVLGFEETRVTYHTQTFGGRPVRLFTVVGKRAVPGLTPCR